MDPNETLRLLRDDIKSWNVDRDSADADLMAERFIALDEWLSEGGFLPTEWKR